MSDPLCVGVCMIDRESGVCLGCGRTPEEIDGDPVALPQPNADRKPSFPLPPDVADQAGEGTE